VETPGLASPGCLDPAFGVDDRVTWDVIVAEFPKFTELAKPAEFPKFAEFAPFAEVEGCTEPAVEMPK
jgi:hypothetical protein